MKSIEEDRDEFYKTLPGNYKWEIVKETLPRKEESPIRFVVVGKKK